MPSAWAVVVAKTSPFSFNKLKVNSPSTIERPSNFFVKIRSTFTGSTKWFVMVVLPSSVFTSL